MSAATELTAIVTIQNEKSQETKSDGEEINLSHKYQKELEENDEQFDRFKVITKSMLSEINVTNMNSTKHKFFNGQQEGDTSATHIGNS